VTGSQHTIIVTSMSSPCPEPSICIRIRTWRPDTNNLHQQSKATIYGAPFVKILYLTDLAQKLLSLRIYSNLCADLAISAQI